MVTAVIGPGGWLPLPRPGPRTMAIGIAIYLLYSRRHSHLGLGLVEVHETEIAEIEPDIPGVADRDRP